MGTKRTQGLPTQLDRLRLRFDRWRRTHKARSRIAEPLWAAAVKVAGKYGLHRTAKALRLDYYSLKKRLEGDAVTASTSEQTASIAGNASAGGDGPRFLQWPLASWPGSGECTLELEDAGGARLRVHLKGFGPPDLAALSRSFWQGE